jgi:predicted amidophosphoribosyltransferase
VPTASKRVRQRGFDHAELLAKKFALLRGLPFRNLLKRVSQSRQFGADRITRKQQIKGVFKYNYRLSGEIVLLIDDVVSTGATIEESAKFLKEAGAKRIHVAVFARNK